MHLRIVRRRDTRRRILRRHAFFAATVAATTIGATAACSQGNPKQQANESAIASETTGVVRAKSDTIAAPPGAVDTSVRPAGPGGEVRVGTPGAGTAQTGADKATGVDTPITKRIRSGEKP